jgi:hypothetical protein
MTDINLKLIKLIEEGKTINEITAELDMTNKQILRRLNDIKMDGINYLRNYHFTGDITLDVTGVDVIIKNDSQSEGRRLDVAVSVNASVTMWEQKDLCVITDAYAINGAIDLTYKKMKFYSALDAIRDTYIYKDSIDVKNTGVDCILDAFCELSEPSLSFKEGLISVYGSLKVTMLLKDTLGSIVTTEKMLDYRYERKSDCGDIHTESQPDILVSSLECMLKDKDQIDVKAEMQINCSVFGET